MTNIQKKHI